MPSIVGVGVCRPRRLTVEEVSEELGLPAVEARRFRRGAGFDKICVDPDRTEVDTLVAAIENVPGIDDIRDRVAWVVRARTIRFGAPWSQRILADVCDRAALPRARAFSVSDHACASGMLTTDLALRLLAEGPDPDAVAIVLAGEKTFGAGSRALLGMALLGEATVAAVVSLGPGPFELLGYASSQVSVGGASLALDEASAPMFAGLYPVQTADVITQAFRQAGVTASSTQWYLPHNVGRRVGVRTAEAVGLAHEKIYHGTLAETGHCWSADTFMNLQAAQRDGVFARGDVVLLTAVGFGATFAAMVIRYRGDDVLVDGTVPSA